MAARVMIMAGGTGGHVFPALAVADALRARGIEVTWLGTASGLEAEVVPDAGIELDTIGVSGLRGKGVTSWLAAPVRLLRALRQAMAVLRRRRPTVVLGMGGFVSGPGGVAARLLRRPLVIHEQNAVAGLTNRLLSHVATRVLEAFPGTFDAEVGAHATGNPVREAIRALPAPAQRFADRAGPLRLLIIGGSQGALALNRTVPEALKALAADERPLVRHQAGRRMIDTAREAYAAADIDADVVPFVADMAEAYGWADLVLCRAGALTVAELAAAGVGSVLVPFPFAVDDHQTRNAAFLADRGAARLVPQNEMTPEYLAGLLKDYARDAREGRAELAAMADRAHALARPEATREVVEHCMEVARG